MEPHSVETSHKESPIEELTRSWPCEGEEEEDSTSRTERESTEFTRSSRRKYSMGLCQKWLTSPQRVPPLETWQRHPIQISREDYSFVLTSRLGNFPKENREPKKLSKVFHHWDRSRERKRETTSISWRIKSPRSSWFLRVVGRNWSTRKCQDQKERLHCVEYIEKGQERRDWHRASRKWLHWWGRVEG